ncbi:MAG: response regulator [Candidatus Omnitrophota bacterium]
MKKKKILFIEDESDQVMLVKTRLESNGFDCISAIDGEEGLKKADSELPDLVLLDLLMPKIDGYEVCKRMKANPKTKDIPIIVITAAGGAIEVEAKCRACGADDIIFKPYESKELIEKIMILIK